MALLAFYQHKIWSCFSPFYIVVNLVSSYAGYIPVIYRLFCGEWRFSKLRSVNGWEIVNPLTSSAVDAIVDVTSSTSSQIGWRGKCSKRRENHWQLMFVSGCRVVTNIPICSNYAWFISTWNPPETWTKQGIWNSYGKIRESHGWSP